MSSGRREDGRQINVDNEMRFGMPSHGTHQVNKRYRVRPRTETNRHLPTGADPSKTHNSWKPHLLRKKEPLRRLSQPMYCFPPQPIRLAWSCGRGIGDRGSKVNRIESVSDICIFVSGAKRLSVHLPLTPSHRMRHPPPGISANPSPQDITINKANSEPPTK